MIWGESVWTQLAHRGLRGSEHLLVLVQMLVPALVQGLVVSEQMLAVFEQGSAQVLMQVLAPATMAQQMGQIECW